MSDLTDLITRVQREFGDDNEIQITKDDIVRWANDGQIEILRRTGGEGQQNGIRTALTVANYANIDDFDNIIFAIEWAELSDIAPAPDVTTQLGRITKKELDRLDSRWRDGINVGQPLYYYFSGRSLQLYPVPNKVYQIRIKGVFKPNILAVGGIEAFEIPYPLRDDLVQYCLRRAYELNADWTAAEVKHSRYTEQQAQNNHLLRHPYEDTYPVVQDVDGYWD